jgi:hypothetical protein
MMIHGDWRYHGDDPPEPGPFHTVVTWATVVTFAVVLVVVSVMLLGALALRFL